MRGSQVVYLNWGSWPAERMGLSAASGPSREGRWLYFSLGLWSFHQGQGLLLMMSRPASSIQKPCRRFAAPASRSDVGSTASVLKIQSSARTWPFSWHAAFRLELGVVPVRLSPLDGLPAPNGFSVSRRILAVKVDNAGPARPQSGIEQADAMIELMVEGGLSRMMALFLESDANYLGPVRSVRPTDALIEALGATVAISGAQPWIADQLVDEGVPIIRETQVKPPAMFRISSRRAPHNLYANTVELRREADSRGYANNPPPDLLRWGAFSYPQAAAAAVVDVSWSDPISTIWHWDGARYLRSSNGTPHHWAAPDGSSGRIAADNLVVIFGQYYEVPAPTGTARVPAMKTIGSGRVVLFTEGRVVEGTWSRPDNETWFTFSTPSGELVVPPGMTWIHVIPHDRPLTWE